MFGRMFSSVVRLVNAPLRAGEKVLAHMTGQEDIPKDERLASMPLEKLAEALEEVDRRGE